MVDRATSSSSSAANPCTSRSWSRSSSVQRLAGLALRDRRDEPVQAVLRLQEERLPVTW
ncbi:hypothetical protein ACFMQL_37805 [Nonomuraea fastidiosa]|uniref:hypothetical protein n=1 Tax=Nonomuraea TaxID=83681 RepID=UPI0034129B4D